MSDTKGTTRPRRPIFLTVLCLLSFVGCLLLFGAHVFGYQHYAAMKEMSLVERLEAAGELVSDLPPELLVEDAMEELIGTVPFDELATAELVKALLTIPVFVGVLLMWKRRKVGFYIFLIGQLLLMVVWFRAAFGIELWIQAIANAIFSLVFIILYGLNLRHLRWKMQRPTLERTT